MLHSARKLGLATLLTATTVSAADNQSPTELPIPADASNVTAVSFPVGVGGWERVTKFQLRRAFPNVEFLVSVDHALGRDWVYCGGWPETSHIGEDGVASGNWCSEITGRTMSVVVEYRISTRHTGSREDSELQDVSVWEDSHMGPCRSVTMSGSKCNSPRPGG